MARKPNARRAVPDDILRLETQQGRCPTGHLLPHKTNRGRCTPVFCAGSSAGTNDRQSVGETKQESVSNPRIGSALKAAKAQAIAEISREADDLIDKMIPGDSLAAQSGRAAAKAQKADELQKLAHQIGRWAAMRTHFKVPEGLQGAEAEEYVKRRVEVLSVDAITDLERDLKLGDDHQRREARRDLLDMAGLRKREAAPNGGSVIMLINQNGAPIQGNLVKYKLGSAATATVDATPTGPQGPKGSEGL